MTGVLKLHRFFVLLQQHYWAKDTQSTEPLLKVHAMQENHLMPCPKGCMRFTLSALRSPASTSRSSPLLLCCALDTSLGL